MLPYLQNRPLTLRVFPDGIRGTGYYRRDLPARTPAWLRSVDYQPASQPDPIQAPLVDDAVGLVRYANRGAIEFHIWLSRAGRLDRPDWAVFDLDPGPGARFADVLSAALEVRQALASDGLSGYVKTSGGRGLHVFVPLEPSHPFEQVRGWVRGIAERLAAAHPGRLAVASGGTHAGRLMTIDHAQNGIARNTAAPYTLRAQPDGPISTPLSWDEVADGQVRPQDFTLRTIFNRLDSVGDLWSPALSLAQHLPAMK